MHNRLISRLAGAQWTVITVGVLMFLYLAIQFPETVVVRDSAATAAQIDGASGVIELRQIAGRLNFLGHGATVASESVFATVTLFLLALVALSLLNLLWLRRLKRLQNETKPNA